MARRGLSLGAAIAAAAAAAVRRPRRRCAAPTEPSRELGTVTVIGRRPTSLPTQIPTTIEGISGADIRVRINATDAEDALKYFPSLVVRKRYIGDYDHAVLASRASGTNNSARSLVYVDGILISNLLGNGATFTPRWGLVTPEEIERVDVLYGPFSAAYPGNSVGAVVDYVTRMPAELEMRASVSSFSEDFQIYRSQGTYTGWQASASVGDTPGPVVSWWLNFNRLDSDAHPVSYANKLVSHGRAGHGRHGRHGRARRSQPAQPGLADPRLHDGHAHDPGSREAQGRLRDFAAPARELHARLVGQRFAALVRDLSAGRGRQSRLLGRDQRRRPPLHRDARGLRADGRRSAPPDARAVAADRARRRLELRARRERVRLRPRPRALADGRIARGRERRRRAHRGPGRHGLDHAGAARDAPARQRDAATFSTSAFSSTTIRLRTLVSNADDWLAGGPTTRVLGVSRRHRARERLRAGHVGVRGAVARDARRARRALGGRERRRRPTPRRRSSSASAPRPTCRRSSRSRAQLDAASGASRRRSAAPCASRRSAELYQGSIASNVVVNNDPNLRPEKSWTSELSGERVLGMRQPAADGVLRGHDRRALLADQRDRHAERHEHPERRRDRHARPRGRACSSPACSATGSMSRRASRTRARGSSRTTTSPRASASGSRACPTGARTRSRRTGSAKRGR